MIYHKTFALFLIFTTDPNNPSVSQSNQTKDMIVVGAMQSVSWSMGRTPLVTISAFVETNVGMTRPGQSQSISDFSSKKNVCKMQRNSFNTATVNIDR